MNDNSGKAPKPLWQKLVGLVVLVIAALLGRAGLLPSGEADGGGQAEVAKEATGRSSGPTTREAELRAEPSRTDSGDGGAAQILAAFRAQRSDLQVEGFGTVQRTLPDDNEGSRHQRFILELANGHTLLVAHNIDLAPRVPLEAGDRIGFFGEFEWTERGGVLHWTHHDPGGRHVGGWLELDGRRFE